MNSGVEEKIEIQNVVTEEKNENKKDKKFNLFTLLVNLIALSTLILFICLVYFSHTNFNAVKNGEKPTGYKEVEKYVKNDRDVTIYNYTLYKIEIVKYAGVETYTLKPFFSSDY